MGNTPKPPPCGTCSGSRKVKGVRITIVKGRHKREQIEKACPACSK